MSDRAHGMRAACYPAARDAGSERGPLPDVPEDADDLAFARRVAEPLRRAVRAAPDFEHRLMAAVRADSRLHRASRPDTQRVEVRDRRRWARELLRSPRAGLCAAAGFAAVAALGSWRALGAPAAADDSGAPAAVMSPVSAGAEQHAHVVRFTVAAPTAARVTLVGAFNGWAKEATPLRPAPGAEGVWTVSVPLPAGRHEYAFLIDGDRWVVDPRAPTLRDEHGIESSVLTVRDDAERAARRS